MWTADDKFFGASLLTKIGIPSPRTIALPNKDYVPGIVHNESLRNLIFPLNWDKLVEDVGGFPCILKDAHGGGWKEVYVIRSMPELIYRYNYSGLLTMILQEYIQWDEYARCMCLGQDEVRVMRYDPINRYYHPEHNFSDEMFQKLEDYTRTICRTLGYDMNTCEFAIKDGVPYAIDFMNPAPDMDINSLGRTHFDWMVTHMADVTIKFALSDVQTRDRYDWGRAVRAAENA
jgi:hypothetical protein